MQQVAGKRNSSLFRTNQTAKKYRITRANISTVMNEEVKMHWKSVTSKFFTVAGIIVEISTSNKKPKCYLEVSLSVGYPSTTVTS